MSKIEHNREAKRHAILSAAKATFLADGYEAASMDGIASRAKVTKQTVYRYYPSKIDLFEATIRFIGESSNANFVRHLDSSNTKDALCKFAEGFIRWHLDEEHISVFRLLVAESAKSSEMVQSFFSVAPDETNAALSEFLSDQLGVSQPEDAIRLWVSMLLAYRDEVLLGMGRPDARTISQYSERATRFFLAGLDQL